MKAEARRAAVPADRSVKNMVYALSSPTSVSVASDPIECARSARPSSIARRYETLPSSVTTGTIRPTSPSQATAGSRPTMLKKPSRRTAGTSVTVPIAVANAIRSRGMRSPATRPVASANERLATAAPITKASGSRSPGGDSASPSPANAGAIPSARDGQKRWP